VLAAKAATLLAPKSRGVRLGRPTLFNPLPHVERALFHDL
jgi:hypothetical protein